MRRRGRPVLGAISGFLFGLFLGLELLMFKVITSASVLLVALPIVGLVAGVALALVAPLGGKGASPAAAAASPASEASDA